jgi:hypothetical protein
MILEKVPFILNSNGCEYKENGVESQAHRRWARLAGKDLGNSFGLAARLP